MQDRKEWTGSITVNTGLKTLRNFWADEENIYGGEIMKTKSDSKKQAKGKKRTAEDLTAAADKTAIEEKFEKN